MNKLIMMIGAAADLTAKALATVVVVGATLPMAARGADWNGVSSGYTSDGDNWIGGTTPHPTIKTLQESVQLLTNAMKASTSKECPFYLTNWEQSKMELEF